MNDIVEQVIKGLDCYEQLDLALGFNEAFERVAHDHIDRTHPTQEESK